MVSCGLCVYDSCGTLVGILIFKTGARMYYEILKTKHSIEPCICDSTFTNLGFDLSFACWIEGFCVAFCSSDELQTSK